MADDERHRRHRHPVSRRIGHALGLAYVLVTLLFGPIRSLARWLERRRIVRRYERGVARLPPVAGLSLSLLALGLLELSKIAVLLSYCWAGLPGAVAAMLCAKASLGYFAHITWRAARPKVIAAYLRAARQGRRPAAGPLGAPLDGFLELAAQALDGWLAQTAPEPSANVA